MRVWDRLLRLRAEHIRELISKEGVKFVEPQFAEIKPIKLTDETVLAYWDDEWGELRPAEEMVEFLEEGKVREAELD